MTDSLASGRRTERTWLLLGGILLLGAGLRFWGIAHGYPYSYYPDEAHFVKRALSFGSGDLNPHWFHKPAFFMYLLFLEYGVFFLFGLVAGAWNGVGEFAVSYVLNPGPFYLIGRATVALFSLAMVWMVYRAGTRLWHRRAGWVAAVLLAVSPGQAWVAKDVKADVPCAFFTLVSAYFLLRFVQEKRTRSLFLSAGFAGLGAATKTYSVVMLLPILAGVFLHHRDSGKPRARSAGAGALCVLVFYGVFFATSPYNFLDPLGRQATFGGFYLLAGKAAQVLGIPVPEGFGPPEELSTEIHNPENTLDVYADGAAEYLRYLVDGMGIPAFILAIAGIGLFFLREKRRGPWLFFLFPMLFSAISVFVHPGYAEVRHQVPLHPFLALWAGGAIHALAEKRPLPRPAWIALILLLCVPVRGIADRNRMVSRPDTRNLAKAWIETHIPAETRILLDENGVQLLRSEDILRDEIQKARSADPEGQFTAHYDRYLEYQMIAAKKGTAYRVQEIRFPWWRDREVAAGVHELRSEFDRDMGNPLKPVGVDTIEEYARSGFEYAVVHGEKYEPFLRDTERARRFPSFATFYRRLFEEGTLVRSFPPTDGVRRPGPEVKIFRLSDTEGSDGKGRTADEG